VVHAGGIGVKEKKPFTLPPSRIITGSVSGFFIICPNQVANQTQLHYTKNKIQQTPSITNTISIDFKMPINGLISKHFKQFSSYS
jgi:hypothetical protein